MTENDSASPTIPTAFRIPRLRRLMLEQIQKERAHENLTETLNEAVNAYIDAYLRERKAA